MKKRVLLIKNLRIRNKKTCTEIARKLNINKYIYLESHKNLERSFDKVVSDCLEAIVGEFT